MGSNPTSTALACDDVTARCLGHAACQARGLSFGPQLVSVEMAAMPTVARIGHELPAPQVSERRLRGRERPDLPVAIVAGRTSSRRMGGLNPGAPARCWRSASSATSLVSAAADQPGGAVCTPANRAPVSSLSRRARGRDVMLRHADYRPSAGTAKRTADVASRNNAYAGPPRRPSQSVVDSPTTTTHVPAVGRGSWSAVEPSLAHAELAVRGAARGQSPVPCQINRPGRCVLTWAGLFECQTIKLPAAVQHGL